MRNQQKYCIKYLNKCYKGMKRFLLGCVSVDIHNIER